MLWIEEGEQTREIDGHVEEGLRRAAAEFWPHLIERAMAVNWPVTRGQTLVKPWPSFGLTFRTGKRRERKPERATPSVNLQSTTIRPSSGF